MVKQTIIFFACYAALNVLVITILWYENKPQASPTIIVEDYCVLNFQATAQWKKSHKVHVVWRGRELNLPAVLRMTYRDPTGTITEGLSESKEDRLVVKLFGDPVEFHTSPPCKLTINAVRDRTSCFGMGHVTLIDFNRARNPQVTSAPTNFESKNVSVKEWKSQMESYLSISPDGPPLTDLSDTEIEKLLSGPIIEVAPNGKP
jgi:hypothetical protein